MVDNDSGRLRGCKRRSGSSGFLGCAKSALSRPAPARWFLHMGWDYDTLFNIAV